MHELSCCLITSFEGAQKVKWVGCRKGAGEQYKMLWIINHCSVLVWVSFVKCFQAGMFVSCWGVQTRVTIPWQKETTLPSIMHMFIPLCICIYIYTVHIWLLYSGSMSSGRSFLGGILDSPIAAHSSGTLGQNRDSNRPKSN